MDDKIGKGLGFEEIYKQQALTSCKLQLLNLKKTFDEETELKSLKKNKHRMSANILHWNKADGINANKNKANKGT